MRKPSPRGAALRIACLACLLVGGCITSPRMETATRGMARLMGDEVVLGPSHGRIPSSITAKREVTLRYQSVAGWIPNRVMFRYRRASGSWRDGPRWGPGEPAPRWTPPDEGTWYLRAVPVAPRGLAVPNRRYRSRYRNHFPEAIVTFDWTPPTVNVSERLPERPVPGGTEIPLRWHVTDAFLGSEPVFLEYRETTEQPWQRVAEVPASGTYRWRVPNRPLAGARVRLVVSDMAGNFSQVVLPGLLTVHDEIPTVSTPEQVRSRESLVSVPYQVTLPSGGEVERVELWVTEDDGAFWRLAGYDEDLQSPLEEPLEEGRFGYRVVVEDQLGNRSAYPAPGDAPAGELVVDWTEPEVNWGDARVRRSNVTDSHNEALLEVTYPFWVRDFEVDPSSIEVSYRHGSAPWLRFQQVFRDEDQIRMEISEALPDPLTFRIAVRDRCGNGVTVESSIYPHEILDPPDVAFDVVPMGWHHPGESVRIDYHCHWERAQSLPVELSYSVDGHSWTVIAAQLKSIGTQTWTLPDIAAREVTLRMRAQAVDGRVREVWSETPFGIEGAPPTATLIGPRVAHGEKIRLLVSGADTGGSGIDHYELFARARGSSVWEPAGTGRPEQGNVMLQQPRPVGHYHLWLVPVDRAGNRGPGPEQAPESRLFAFQLQEGPPGVRMLSFQEGGAYAGGSRHLLFFGWSGEKPLGGTLSLEYSTDDGGVWRPIGKVLITVDRYYWQLPVENIRRCRVRVVADEVTGRRSIDGSRIPFTVDASPPVVTILNVTPHRGGGSVVNFETEDRGESGLRCAWLYTTSDDGATWERHEEPCPGTSPWVVKLPPGAYGLRMVGEDHAGNVAHPPSPGTVPEYTYQVEPDGGVEITIVYPRQGVFAGGTRHYVFWRLEPVDAQFGDRPVTLEYAVEGTDSWRTIATHLPLEGREAWNVPDLEGAQLRLRAVAMTLDGEHHEAYAPGPIVVDSSTPNAMFVGPNASRARPTVIEYRVTDAENLERVELWLRSVSTPEWRLVAQAGAGEPLSADVPDGMYRVQLVATDAAGNRAHSPARGENGSGDLLVDTVAPLLEVDGVGDRARLFHGNEWLVIRPRVQDRHLSAFPVSFRLSSDGGMTFKDLKRYHPNGDDFPWRLPSKAGVYYLEVSAVDLAGNSTRQVVPLQVIPTPPMVTLLTDPSNSVLAGGSELRLEWESRGVAPLDPGMTVEFTADGEQWHELMADLPADGGFDIELPEVDSNRCRLRLTLTDADGLTGRAWSGIFTISTTPPRVDIDDVQPVRDDDGRDDTVDPESDD